MVLVGGKQWFNIKQMKVCGESGDVQGISIDSWKEQLPEIVEGYAVNNIWNMEFFGRHYLIKDLEEEEVKGESK